MLLLYAYCAGIVSSRKIERACYEDLAFRVLTGNQQPDHSRISEFRRRNLEALSGLFVQILRFCQEAGMVSLGHVALDGTKVQANASKHKAMSHERMLKAEAQLEKEIKELMRKAEILDAQEDGKYGKGKLGSELPEDLRRRKDRLEKIRQARKALEAEAAAAASRDRAKQAAAAEAAAADADAEAEADATEQQKLRKKANRSREKAEAAKRSGHREGTGEAGLEPEGLEPQAADAMPQRGLAHRADGSPKASAQRNFTDPDSHIMKSDGNLLQGYNCQAAVDGDHQVIVAMGVSNQPPDVEHLEPMLERTIANTGACPKTFIAVAAGCDDPGNPRSSGLTLRRPTRFPVVVFQKICRPGLMGPISREASDLIRAWSRGPITVLSGFPADRSFPTTIKKRWHHQHWHRSARTEHLTSLSASTPTKTFTWRSPWPPMAASSVSTESPPLARDTTI